MVYNSHSQNWYTRIHASARKKENGKEMDSIHTVIHDRTRVDSRKDEFVCTERSIRSL